MSAKSEPETALRLPDEAGWAVLAAIAEIIPGDQQGFREGVCDAIRFAHRGSVRLIATPRLGELVPRLERIVQLARDLQRALSSSSVAGIVSVGLLEKALPPPVDIGRTLAILGELVEGAEKAVIDASQEFQSRGRTHEERFLKLRPFLKPHRSGGNRRKRHTAEIR